MPRFFHPVTGDTVTIHGDDARHMTGALRLRPGDAVTVCDEWGTDYACALESASGDTVRLRVVSSAPTVGEPPMEITLYQAVPKGDKMEYIVQKSVELGAARIVPMHTRRCVAKADGKKAERWQRIAREAAGQCERGIVPAVAAPVSFEEALALTKDTPTIVCYEGGGQPMGDALAGLAATRARDDDRPAGSLPEKHPPEKGAPSALPAAVALFIGAEGGFDPEEIDKLVQNGAWRVTLGKRILRCETAPLAALTLLLHEAGEM
ncbi:MAG: 16S rRNA (uracil(1498)-N(3))-methyltransferase [Oscillospiraceae bacterium]|nr:16S rRNA (uracil(1498)-N(3))-methyltransferase [Oscillospiraceae bacterium]